MKRRNFLWLLGVVSGSTVMSACGSPNRSAKFTSYLLPPEEGIVPGEATFRPSTCTECPAGCGVTARIREGRPVKLEGIPGHPVNDGGLCLRGQSSLYRLYHPERVRGPMARDRGKLRPISWEDAFSRVAGSLEGSREKGRKNLFLSGRTTGSLSRLVDATCAKLGIERLSEYEVYSHTAEKEANGLLFGERDLPHYRIEEADFLLTVGADLLETYVTPVAYTRKISSARARGDFLWHHVEPHMSLTGANADRRFVLRPGRERSLLSFLLREVLDRKPPKSTVARGTPCRLAPDDGFDGLRGNGHPAGVVEGDRGPPRRREASSRDRRRDRDGTGGGPGSRVGRRTDPMGYGSHSGTGRFRKERELPRRRDAPGHGGSLRPDGKGGSRGRVPLPDQPRLLPAAAPRVQGEPEKGEPHRRDGRIPRRDRARGGPGPSALPLPRVVGRRRAQERRRIPPPAGAPSPARHLVRRGRPSSPPRERHREGGGGKLRGTSARGVGEAARGDREEPAPRKGVRRGGAAEENGLPLREEGRLRPPGRRAGGGCRETRPRPGTPSLRTFDGRSRILPILSEIPDPLTTITYGPWISISEEDAARADSGTGTR